MSRATYHLYRGLHGPLRATFRIVSAGTRSADEPPIMNKSLLLTVGSLSLLALAACADSSESPALSDNAPVAASEGNTPPGTSTPPSAATPAPSTSTPAPSTSTPTAPKDPPFAKHCSISSQTGDVCFENAQGHPGDVIDIEVVLIGDATCNVANEAYSQLSFELSKFVLQNVADVQDCRTRRIGPNINNEDVLYWNAFGEHVVSGCSNLPIGKVDTIKLKIMPGTPPGDYDLSLGSNTDFVPPPGSNSICGWHGGGVAAKIRVLP